jgi:hypothetical protein
MGYEGAIDVVRDFFGYTTGVPFTTSLSRQMRLVHRFHVGINVILVGADAFGQAEREEVDEAVAIMRDAYAAVEFGVAAVHWYFISTDDANGREHIANDNEAADLTHEWTVQNSSIDVFFVQTYAGSSVGTAPRKGPENKDTNYAMTGVVLAIEGSPAVTGQVLAREVCRYLGLKDSDDSDNLMFPTVPNGGKLTWEQRDEMIMPGPYNTGPFISHPCQDYPLVSWARHRGE